MKKLLTTSLFALGLFSIACKVGKGCPSSGRNVGAERVLSGDSKTMKDLRKAGKFRS